MMNSLGSHCSNKHCCFSSLSVFPCHVLVLWFPCWWEGYLWMFFAGSSSQVLGSCCTMGDFWVKLEANKHSFLNWYTFCSVSYTICFSHALTIGQEIFKELSKNHASLVFHLYFNLQTTEQTNVNLKLKYNSESIHLHLLVLFLIFFYFFIKNVYHWCTNRFYFVLCTTH